MALADPLDLTSYFTAADFKSDLQFQQEASGTGNGEKLYADRGPALRRLEITTPPMTHAAAEALIALLNSRGGGLRTILVPHYRAPWPSTDPEGTTFGSATPDIGTITDRLNVAFVDFPAGYVIPAGTYFGVNDGSGRRYLGQFCEARTANGSGAVASVQITPALPAAFTTGDVVDVVWPVAKYKLVPGTAIVSQVTVGNSRVTFQADQTYEADPT